MKTRNDKKQFDRFINDAIENTRALNETEPQPTPTPPWKATFDKDYGTYIEEDTDKGFQIAKVLSQEESRNADEVYLSPTEAKANAKLIVRAVNSHEELLQELRDGALIADLVRERWTNGDLAEAVNFLMAWRKSAIKAIAKAESKSA